MKQFAFKLVRRGDDGEYKSYLLTQFSNGILPYRLLQKTTHQDGTGPLACFSDIPSALEFLRKDTHKISILECEWDRFALLLCEIEPSNCTKLWRDFQEYLDGRTFSMENIAGSITAWSVTPIAEISVGKEYAQYDFSIYKKYAVKIVSKRLPGSFPDNVFESYASMFTMTYKIGEKTSRNKENGPLACFDNIYNAIRFVTKDYANASLNEIPWKDYKFFECEIVPSNDKDLWYKESEAHTYDMSMENIQGSVTAESVTLTNDITPSLEEILHIARKFRRYE